MVVDDDPDLVDALCEWFELSSDWTAVGAYGQADAIAQVGASRPDAILLDIEMAGADGLEIAERLNAASGSGHPALLAMTGSATLKDAASTDARFTVSMLKPANSTACSTSWTASRPRIDAPCPAPRLTPGA